MCTCVCVHIHVCIRAYLCVQVLRCICLSVFMAACGCIQWQSYSSDYIDDAVNGTLLNRFINGSWLYNVSVQRYVTDSPGYFAAVPIVSRSQTTQPVSFAISPVGGSTFYRSKLEVTTGPSSGRRINTLAVFIHGEPPSRKLVRVVVLAVVTSDTFSRDGPSLSCVTMQS